MSYRFAVSKLSANDEGQRNCPKHVEFYSRNILDKLVHLVGFVIRIYQDERSPERQIKKITATVIQLSLLPWFFLKIQSCF